MIASLEGKPVATGDRWVVLEVNGIGYRVYVPEPEIREIAGADTVVKLHTHMAVREDAITLYGFMHESELELFTVLISVSGIGPQIALNILSQISLEDFVLAILSGDEKSLTRISGIGQKSAQRLILELRDKMKKVQGAMTPTLPGKQDTSLRDAASALVSLGFAESASYEAVKAAARGLSSPSVQEIIKAALRYLKEAERR
ncbi:Holliday junction branch migration protein RuvA [Methanoregula sp.]|uniref:Holliday junction branch migration protein RuvA n=1 Tax=Methanoregula sp. TaxID=2052170 RepID=UPI002C053CC7|nr:Holliday junction branch migration protein RuvA [Methanoregula sp.]HVP96429.1 Holliday junction branch migration protein RuvA [Methanoregula sp.]